MKTLGVPEGYKHNWTYRGRWNETKTGPKKWKFTFKATKKTKAGKGGPKPGYKVHWKIKADQYAIKTNKGTYQTLMKGTKKLVTGGKKEMAYRKRRTRRTYRRRRR